MNYYLALPTFAVAVNRSRLKIYNKISMTRILTLFTFALLVTMSIFGQNIDSLQLTEKEIPENYTINNENNCISIQARILYDNTTIYEVLIGKIKQKKIQSFDSKKETGSIIYFEFENEFTASVFLEGLLWGGSKPTKEHPEEYFNKGNYLIIWSFKKGSLIKKISEEKIKALLK